MMYPHLCHSSTSSSLTRDPLDYRGFLLRGSDGFSRARGRRPRVSSHSSPIHFDQKKKHYLVTLALVSSRRNARLRAQTSIDNIYDRKSTFFGPDGSSGQLAVKHATGAEKSLCGVSRWGHALLGGIHQLRQQQSIATASAVHKYPGRALVL